MSQVLELELVDGVWRLPGAVSAAELEELERMHDAGDLRAESRLELLRKGRPGAAAGEPPFTTWRAPVTLTAEEFRRIWWNR